MESIYNALYPVINRLKVHAHYHPDRPFEPTVFDFYSTTAYKIVVSRYVSKSQYFAYL